MQSTSTIILQLIQNVSLFALVVVGYAAIRRRVQLSPALRDAVIGLVFGGGAMLAMSLPVNLAPGVIIDGRSVLTGTVAVFGGPVGAVIALAISAGYRLWLGGAGAPGGTVSIIGTGAISLIFYLFLRRGLFKAGPLAFFLLGLAVVIQGVSTFYLASYLASRDITFPIIGMLAVPLLAVVPIGTVILGVVLQREDARLALQAKLAEQTHLFETVFNSMSEGVSVIDATGRIIMVNRMSEALTGVPATDTPSAEWAAAFGVYERDGKTLFTEERMPLVRTLRGEATDDVEMLVRNHLDGKDRLLSVSGRPLLDAEGRPQGGVAVFRDVTAQTEMEEAIRRSEERFALAIAGSRDGIFDYNPVTEEVWFSPRYKEILGYSDADFPNDIKFWKSLMLPEDHAATTKQFFEFEAGGVASIEIVQRFRHKNGSLIHAQNRALGVRDETGRVVRLIGAITDITPLIRAEARLKEAINAMESGFALFDADDRLVLCNEGFADPATRAKYGSPIGRTFEEIFETFAYGELTAIDALPNRAAWLAWRLAMHKSPPEAPLEIQWTDGRWMRVTERRTAEGGYVGTWTDITPLKAAEARLRDAIESINEGFALFDRNMRFVIFNQRFLDLYPLSAPAIVPGASIEEVLFYGATQGEYPGLDTPEAIDDFVRTWASRFRDHTAYMGEGAFADGRWVLVSQRATASGGTVGVRADITAQKQREQALLLQQELLRSITDAMPILICFIDAEERYRYCNRIYLQNMGFTAEAVMGRTLREVFGPETYAVMAPQVAQALQGEPSSFERPLVNTTGRYVEGRYIPQQDVDGRIEGFYVVFWDITERHAKEQRLIEQATTDKLTGLLNRGQFVDLLREELLRQARYGQHVAVMYLDVDRFKQINDSLGHHAGDTVLVAFAERLRGAVRASDRVARFGGDEFVVLLVAPRAQSDVEAVAEKLLLAARMPVEVNGAQVAVSTSIGIAYAGRPISSPDIMLETADAALYAAKRAGRNAYRLQVIDI